MLEAKLLHASILRRIFDSIKDMVTDVNLDCDENGLRLQAMDSSHVALVALRLEDSGFVHFRCDRDRTLGLNMPSVCKVFKLCGNNDTVALQNRDESDILSFLFENAEEERMASFDLRLMAIEQDSLGVPDGDQKDVTIRMPSKEFVATMRTMNEFSDTVRLEVDKTGVRIVTKGDIGGGEMLLKPREAASEDDVGVELKVNSPVTQSFAVKYLNMFAKSGCLSDTVTIMMTAQRPVEVQFEISDVTESKEKKRMGEIKFYLAPKMDDDDEAAPNDHNMEDE